MTATRYYTLWASLPLLPHFTRAVRLPINRQRLEARLTLLTETDYQQLYAAAPLLAWDREVVGHVDDQVARQFEAALPRLVNPVLREFVHGQIENRTVLAALRRRQLGQHSPKARRKWGVGRRVRWIAGHWNEPNFQLDAPLPWVARARDCLESGDAVGLQRMMLSLAWQELGQITERHPFRFEAVFAYAFKWGILNRWLTYDATAAAERFRELVGESMGEHEACLA